jgi:hypothetical protein
MLTKVAKKLQLLSLYINVVIVGTLINTNHRYVGTAKARQGNSIRQAEG